MSDEVRELFGTIAKRYDFLNHLFSLSLDRLWRRQAVKTISSDDEIKVLDLCAGTLDMTVELLKRNPFAKITAVDFSQPMLDKGQKKLAAAVKGQVQIICGDCLKIPLPDNSFDVVMCAYGMRNLDDPLKGVREINRLLKKGGRLVVLDFFRPEAFITKLFYQSYARFAIPLVGSIISKNKNAYRYLRASILQFFTMNDFKRLLKQNGFADIAAQDQSFGISGLVTATKA